MQAETQQVPQTILDQLYQSRVAGFPFFAYTGIKAYNLEGNDTLYLYKIPRNPNHITGIQIVYDEGYDLYRMAFFTKNQRSIPHKQLDQVYFDQMAEIIVNTMGVF